MKLMVVFFCPFFSLHHVNCCSNWPSKPAVKKNPPNMAPGPFSGLLAPFIGARKSKKYEKLQTDDPEKKRQEATQEEINRLHTKIVSLLPHRGCN